MTNPIANWWRSRRFHRALKQGNSRLAEQILQQIEDSGAKLSVSEQLFKQNLVSDRTCRDYRKQIGALKRQCDRFRKQIQHLEHQQFLEAFEPRGILSPDPDVVSNIINLFNLIDRDEAKLQCLGIDEKTFDRFESQLAQFVTTELEKIPTDKRELYLEDAIADIEGLKRGVDPNYCFKLTPHVYLMRYFLENVYCTYLAWFLVYKSGLLPKNIKILDIAAGPGTVAYGLALFLESLNGFLPLPQLHISYYSLEQFNDFQYRGLQFWRRYFEAQPTGTNAYFRFDTVNLFNLEEQLSKLPESFFDFVTISHCFFIDAESRSQAHQIYRQVFEKCLNENGYALLIVQGTKLFKIYDVRQTEDIQQEKSLIENFVEELGLKLEWYKYLTSTERRTYTPDFGKYARENLPTQKYMTPIMQEYLKIPFEANYTIDDYAILAKR